MTRVRVRGWWLVPLAVAAIAVTPWPGWAVEAWYSRAIFPMIQRGLTTVSNLTPVAIIDVGLVLAAVFLVSVAIRVVTAGRARGWRGALWEGARRIVRVAALLALLFLMAWGLNYRRLPRQRDHRRGGRRRSGIPAAIRRSPRGWNRRFSARYSGSGRHRCRWPVAQNIHRC